MRETDKGQAITEVCREHNVSQVTFHRWKRQFGQMEVNEARRFKEMERENTELKKMPADSLLKNRVLEAVCEKNYKPGHRRQAARSVVAAGMCPGRVACRILGLARSTFWYRGRAPSEEQRQLLKRIKELSNENPRYSYRRIAALLRQEGYPVGKRQIQRRRRSVGLRVPPTKRQILRHGVSTGLPTKAATVELQEGKGTGILGDVFLLLKANRCYMEKLPGQFNRELVQPLTENMLRYGAIYVHEDITPISL